MLKPVLILSPHFPPSSLAGVHRARLLAKALPAHCWRPIVIRAAPEHYTETGDPDLARLMPDSVEQVHTNALPARLTRKLGIGDIGLRGYHAFGRALEDTAARTGAQVALLTGSPFYPLLLAKRLKRAGLKVVLDFQDPWVSPAGVQRPKLSKGGLSHRLACLLEPHALRYADAITSVSEEQNRQMRARYPFLADIPMAAIPIGGDPDDFVALRAQPPAEARHPLDPGKLNLCYVGTFMPRSGPLMAVMLKAAGLLAERRPDLGARLVLNFVGTSNQPDGAGRGPTTALAAELGLSHLVRETPARVPYLQALALLAQADGLMLVGSDEPHYTASKIYPNLMAARPYLSIFHAASSAHRILSTAGGGLSYAFEDVAHVDDLVPQMAEGLQTILEHPDGVGTPDPVSYAEFTADGVAAAFGRIFER